MSNNTYCPSCKAIDPHCVGSVESDLAILGVDEYVWECVECPAEWVQEKGGSLIVLLNQESPFNA